MKNRINDEKDLIKKCIINTKQYLKEKRFNCKKETYPRLDGTIIERSCKVPRPFDSYYGNTAKEICNNNRQREISIINKLLLLESIIYILRTKKLNYTLKLILLNQFIDYCIQNNLQDFLNSIIMLLNLNLI